MNNIKVFLVDWLTSSVNEVVTCSCESDGDFFTIFLNRNLPDDKLIEAYNHALAHIESGDFYLRGNVNEIETERHAV